MKRVRVSTTVDGERLRRCREIVKAPDSQVLDQALAALERETQEIHERAVLEEHPYELDFDTEWRPPTSKLDPYEGPVPKEVLALARSRRRSANAES